MATAKTEWEVAKQAEKKLTQALRDATSGFKRHITQNPADKSIHDAKAKAKTKRYGSRATGDIRHYVRSIAIQMPRHGFIQHFGVETYRQGGTRTRQNPTQTTYSFKTHLMQMEPRPFIDAAIDRSNVVPYVMENLARLRGEEILVGIKTQFEKK